MKYILLLLLAFSPLAFAEDISTDGKVSATGGGSTLGLSASIEGKPDNPGVIGVYGRSINNSGVVGTSVSRDGVSGLSHSGVGGNFSSFQGTAIQATSFLGGGVALDVIGRIVKPHQPGHRIKVYHPETGALIGVFEYEFE